MSPVLNHKARPWPWLVPLLLLLLPWQFFDNTTSVQLLMANAQRLNYCFDDEEHFLSCEPLTEEAEELDDEDPQVASAIFGLCTELIADYLGGDDEVVEEEGVEIFESLLSNLPAESDLCHRIRLYFSYCDWCTEQPCGFDEVPLTCNVSAVEDYDNEEGFWLFAEDVTAEYGHVCALLEENMKSQATNLTAHPELLAEIGGSEEECLHFRRSYPNCYFCADNITTQDNDEDGPNYCSWDALCEQANTLREEQFPLILTTEQAEAVNQTCHDIEYVVNDGMRQIYHKNVCDRAPLALATQCPQFCQACFDPIDNPLTCEMEAAPVPDDHPELQDFLAQLEQDVASNLDIVATLCVFLTHQMEARGTENILDVSEHLTALADVRASSPWCGAYRYAYPQCFWCSAYTNDYDCSDVEGNPFCHLEQAPEPYEGDDKEAFQAACHEMQKVFLDDIFPSTRELCRTSQQYSKYCPCGEVTEEHDYLGADTTAKKQVLVWMPRVAAALSFGGASYILWYVVRSPSNRGIVYFQLLACMAVFDLMTAVAWAFSTAPINNPNIQGAHGTAGTCTAQGFFIQLGLTSVFLNFTLAVYYWLVICDNVREARLRKLRPSLFLPPLVVGCGLALAGLPFYQGFDYGCHILPLPRGQLWQVLLFVALPVGISILCITLVMMRLYWKVREQSRAANRWRLGFGGSASLEQQVFWQALFYTLSFYVTWPVVLCVYVTGVDESSQNFGFSVWVAFVAPLQGFNNWLVFIRPKLKTPIEISSLRTTTSKYFSKMFGSSDGLGDGDYASDDDIAPIRMIQDIRGMDPSVVAAMDDVDVLRMRTTASVAREEEDEDAPGAVETTMPTLPNQDMDTKANDEVQEQTQTKTQAPTEQQQQQQHDEED